MKAKRQESRRQLDEFLSALFRRNELIEIRFIESWISGGKKRSRVVRPAQWLRRDAIASQYHDMTDFARRELANVYFGVCPRLHSGDAHDDCIETVRCLWCDIDNVTASEALSRWTHARIPSPSIVVSSGSGIHGYWLLQRNLRSRGERALVAAMLPHFYRSFGGDHVQNLSRVMRLPGTVNRKNARNGRPTRPCALFACQPEVRYPFEAFSEWIDRAEQQRHRKTPSASSRSANKVSTEAILARTAEAAALAGDPQRAIETLERMSGQSPELRAVSDARRARLHAERGDQAGYEQASRAAHSEPRLHAYLQAWRLLMTADTEGDSTVPGPREGMSDEAASASSSVARADEAARHGDGAAFVAALQREANESPDDLAAAAALAIAEVADATGATNRRTALLRAEERAPANPWIGRALLLDDEDLARRAQRWTREGRAATGARSAFAFTMAARLATAGSEAAISACEDALKEQADYWPALWELEDNLGSPEARATSAATQARLDPAQAVSGTLRAALWAPSVDEGGEGLGRTRAALNHDSPDPLLVEHLFEAVGGATETGGDLMAAAARQLDLLPYLERAAAAYRSAGLPGRAAKVLREASLASPDDETIRVQRKDAELHASEFARLADSAMRRAREATDDAERLGAFCAMAEVDRLARRDMQSARLSLQSIAELRPDHIPTARALEWDALREDDPRSEEHTSELQSH